MDEIKNPFIPGAGVQPPELTGREEFLRRANITLGRAMEARYGKSFIAVGLRGVGKTVLLNRVRQIAEEIGCLVVMLESHDDKDLPSLITPYIRKILLDLDRVEAVCEQAKTALRVFRSFIGNLKISYGDMDLSLGIDPAIGTADSGDLEIDLPDLFVSMGKASKARKKVIVIILDEIQYLSEKEMSALVMAMHKTSQDQLPIILIGAGLPLLVGKMGESKSYAERLFDFPKIDALNYDDACRAIVEPVKRQGVNFSEEALFKIYNYTKGYPYFLQEWAYVSWNVASEHIITGNDVDEATPLVISKLDESFFRVRFDRLTQREKQYLRAMAELGSGPHRSGDISDILKAQNSSLGPCRSNLISKGMIYSPSFGDTAFTVPLFDKYMKRVMAFAPWN